MSDAAARRPGAPDALWVYLAVALPVVAALAAPLSTVDLAYAIRAGDLILAAGAPLTADPFTFTVGGEPWVDQQWGAQALLALLHRAGGWELLALARALLVGAIAAALVGAARTTGAGARTAALLGLGAFLLAAPGLALRAQLGGLALLAATILLVARRRHAPRGLLLVPLVAAAWANLHGTFVLAPAVVLAAALDDRLARRPGSGRLALLAGVTALATGLTPWGLGVWGYAISLGISPEVRGLVTEWQPPDPLGYPGLPFALAAVGLAALALRRLRHAGRRGLPLGSLGIAAALALAGTVAERGIVPWALVAVPAAAGLLVPGRPSPPPGAPDPAPAAAPAADAAAPAPAATSAPALAVALAVALAGVALLPAWRPLTGAPLPLLADAPVAVAARVAELTRPGERIFVPQRYASWFELAVPGRLVPVDSRVELFPARVWSDYLAIAAGGTGAAVRLERWGVALVALDPTLGSLVSDLTATRRYELVEQIEDWALLRPAVPPAADQSPAP
ncbi:MAG: hypothetical protein RL338_362 [Chloroflexota bacterium]